jgi:capsular exopolysaccharide synthesis family protein
MDLHQYLQAMRKFWPVILIPALLAGLSGVYSASQEATKYRASVTFFISTAADETASSQVQGDEFAQRRVNSYIELATTDRLADAVADRADNGFTAAQVQKMLGAKGDLDTVLLTTHVTYTSPAVAQEVATALAREFPLLVQRLEASGDSQSAVSLQVVSGPSVRELPGQGKLMTALRAFVGLLIGVGIALLLELRDNAVRTEEHLRGVDAGPVLGRIPFDRRVRTFPLIVEADHRSGLAESFRQLRTNLQFIDVELPVQVLVITSSIAGEGKSVVVSNLGLSLAAANRRVLVIEADLRRPTLSDHFGIPRDRGLTDVLAGHASIDDVIREWVEGGMSILPSGPLPPNPSELLGSAAMRGLIQQLRPRFDVIIIDTPPLLPVTDGAVAASWADGVALVVRTGRSTRQQVAHSVHALQAVNARLLGVVMTMAPTGRGSGYETYETYEAREASEAAAARRPFGGRPRPHPPEGMVEPATPPTPGPVAPRTTAPVKRRQPSSKRKPVRPGVVEERQAGGSLGQPGPRPEGDAPPGGRTDSGSAAEPERSARNPGGPSAVMASDGVPEDTPDEAAPPQEPPSANGDDPDLEDTGREAPTGRAPRAQGTTGS